MRTATTAFVLAIALATGCTFTVSPVADDEQALAVRAVCQAAVDWQLYAGTFDRCVSDHADAGSRLPDAEAVELQQCTIEYGGVSVASCSGWIWCVENVELKYGVKTGIIPTTNTTQGAQ